jgi:23S rRNA pseudouridine1911/1915/1917 synthase
MHRDDYKKSILRWSLPKTGALDTQLYEWAALESSRLNELIELGAVYCNEKRIRSREDGSSLFKAGSSVRIHSEPRRYSIHGIDWAKRIKAETSNYIAIDKPAGLPTHPMVDNWQENALIQLELFYGMKLFLTHRLDRATEGLLLIAKNSEFQRAFNQIIQDERTEKIYRAKVDKALPQNTPSHFEHWMLRSKNAPKKVLHILDKDSLEQFDECKLEILSKNENFLEIKLLTGRTHQIRAQLSFVKSPIFGDSLYGSRFDHLPEQICLQSAALSFIDPSIQERVSLHLAAPTWFPKKA